MRCLECGGTFIKKRGLLTLNNDYIGEYIVDDIEYSMCDSCSEYSFQDEALEKIEKVESKEIQNAINRLPIKDFIPAGVVAIILGISRQAIHKHPRIRRGFIYFTTIGGKRFYNKKSVELYKDQGDGRFKLKGSQHKRDIKYLVTSTKATITDFPKTEKVISDIRYPSPKQQWRYVD